MVIAAESDAPVGAWRHSHTLVHPRGPSEPMLGHVHNEATLRLAVQWPTPGVVAVRIGGEVDLASLPRLTEMIRQRLRAASLDAVVLDFSEVTYASSAALELLMTARRRCKQRGIELVVVPGGRPVGHLLELAGLTELFTLRPDLPAALNHT
ncbi:STAS domain-containing protein [Saccharopolyspora griseoalba]|uniref:Anti-sigma factor antagonist n=1 Tax=Saccharopolyspora griseoalba TaxID=1431848 RepID=A0ABW2LF81_9PSEU